MDSGRGHRCHVADPPSLRKSDREAAIAGKESSAYRDLDLDAVEARVLEVGINRAADELGVSPAGLRNKLLREGRAAKKGEAPKGEQTYTLDHLPDGSGWTPERLMERLGLDPEKFEITNVRVRGGHWGRPDDPNSQIRLEVSVRPIREPFRFPSLDEWKPIPKPKKAKRSKDEPEKIAVCSDQHAPFHSKPNHRLLCRFLEDEQPDRIIVAGDLLDFPDVSRHRTIPGDKFDASVNDCLQAGFEILADYRNAAPDARIDLLPGNHDVRLAHKIIDQAEKVWNITAANDDVPALSLRRLLHLDYLYVNYVDETDWKRAKVDVNSRLTIRHGYSTKKHPGPTLLASLGDSTIQGHSHRTSTYYQTSHTIEGPRFRVAAETGCLCEIDDGLGYAVEADWQPAFLRVLNWPDEDFLISTCLFLTEPNRLLIPDGRKYIDTGG